MIDHAAEQLERYAMHESGLPNPSRVAGVGIDGETIFFTRFRPPEHEPYALPLFEDITPNRSKREKTYDRVGPFPINAGSVGELLVYFRALERRSLSAELLAQSFGPTSEHAKKLVGHLLRALDQLEFSQTNQYAEWNRIFGIVYGVDETRGTKYIGELRNRYKIVDDATLKAAFFAIHTYFALLMKLLAAELVSLQSGSLVSSFLASLDSLSVEQVRTKFQELESGEFFSGLGVRNFLEGDFFSWYSNMPDDEFWRETHSLCRELARFEPATGVLDPGTTRDLLKELYEALIPQSLRHHLGEYYTPDWLAELTLDRSGFTGVVGQRLLDPACGSGTFLALAIRRVRERGDLDLRDRREIARTIVRDIVGFDLNPLAVIAARTNFLLALGPLLRFVTPLTLPVYLCDSVLTPKRTAGAQMALGGGGLLASSSELLGPSFSVATSAGDIEVPADLIADKQFAAAIELFEHHLIIGTNDDELGDAASHALGYARDSEPLKLITAFYRRIRQLSAHDDVHFWTRYLKNALAPLSCGKFNFVVGNPPWIGWEELSAEYRAATASMWGLYGLFTLRGHAAHLGGGKKDLSMLMLYVAADNYLTSDGRLAFVITHSVLKSRKAGDGFRRFRLGNADPLSVQHVDDFSLMKPFRASNLTIIMSIQKGEETSYPVRYESWSAPRSVRPNNTWALSKVESQLRHRRLSAYPVSHASLTSPWLTLPLGLDALLDLIGPAAYKAQAGMCTWLNSVFFVQEMDRFADGTIVIKNVHDAGDIRVRSITLPIEPDLLFPTCLMRDVQRWKAAPSCWSIVPQDPQTKRGFDPAVMRARYPRTLAYLQKFEDVLRARSGYKKFHKRQGHAFYSVYDVDEATFYPYHVMWQQMKPQIDACVVGSLHADDGTVKPIITQHVVSIVGLRDEDEAYYLAAWMNSSLSTVISKCSSTGKSYGSPSSLHYMPVPRYDVHNNLHIRLVALSRTAHGHELVSGVQAEIDRTVSQLLGLSEELSHRIVREAALDEGPSAAQLLLT